MEASYVVSSSSSSYSLCPSNSRFSYLKPQVFFFNSLNSSSCTGTSSSFRKCRILNLPLPSKSLSSSSCFVFSLPRRTSVLSASALSFDEILEESESSSAVSSSTSRETVIPKIDKSGRFCSPRAARELALSIIYAACLEGSDPVRLFEKRMNFRREPGYEFDKTSLMEYNHMSFGGPPVIVETVEEADELLRHDEKSSEIEAEILSAPPKLVYSKLILRFTRKLLVAVVESWDSHVLVIDKVVPQNWKNEPAGRILELSILHLAMSEIAVLGTRHQIVINEAVDLAKRFCDGAAPRIVNGCLRTFVKDLEVTGVAQGFITKQPVLS